MGLDGLRRDEGRGDQTRWAVLHDAEGQSNVVVSVGTFELWSERGVVCRVAVIVCFWACECDKKAVGCVVRHSVVSLCWS